ncbi:hypothetical protein EFJ25_09500, partial [Staphylococcus haemolyticus]
KKDNFYIISIEIVFFHLSRYFMSRTHFLLLFLKSPYIINKRRYNFVHINPIVNKPNAIYSDK